VQESAAEMSEMRKSTPFVVASILLGLTAASATVAAQSAPPNDAGTVTGVVFDSIAGGPLADAAVFLWNTPHRAETDEAGRFRIEGVPAGEYSLLFFHTRLGELGVSPGPRAVTVTSGSTQEMSLATPSLQTVVQSQCLMEGGGEDAGALAGRVTDAESQLALSGAFVELSWHVEGEPTPETIGLNAGPDGLYRTCAAPADVPVLVSANYYGRRNARLEVTVAPDGFTQLDVPLYDLSPTRVAGHLVDNASGRAVEGAETWLRGTRFRALSDGSGNFAFDGVPPGTYMLMTDHLAYGIKMDTLEVPSGQSLMVEMRLDNRPIEIAPVVVTAEARPIEIARRRGGIVISREDIERVRQRSRDASDVLRSLHIPGIIVRHQSNGVICVGFSTGQVKMNQNGCVEMMIYINDVRATDADLALRLSPEAIERMVIYKPVQAGNLFGLGGGNGVWMIYTRGN
jgi:protocatechuate 3,4-dioxygenase beta subunit